MLRVVTAAALGALGSVLFVGFSGLVLLWGLDNNLLAPAIGIIAGSGALIGVGFAYRE